MGSKQSKRSVDISGKEGEGAATGGGEVVAAGGEGRVEPIADVDTLKPQLNGDTPHIEPPEQISVKEKQLENGTPENEKDATTEKETVVTNGSGSEERDNAEQDNGDPKPTPEAETNKKNKKEKVKKKWSLRSISFSRKDKPKQEKKNKEEENKANGETDKLPEENAEASAIVEQAEKVVSENKDEKTPETPVTEPITNGNSSPETPKEESPAEERAASRTSTPVENQVKASEQPETVLTNGLSEEGKEEAKSVEALESKVEETPAPASEEPASNPAIPVTTEVCVGQNPPNDTTPPPLPVSPPPSSVTAFAETTMAPHLVDAPVAQETEKSDFPAIEVKISSITDLPSSPNENENTAMLPLKNSAVDVKVESDNTAEKPLEESNEIKTLKTKEQNAIASYEQDHVEIIPDENLVPLVSSVNSAEVPKQIIDNIMENKSHTDIDKPKDAHIDNADVPEHINIDTRSAVASGDHKTEEKIAEIENLEDKQVLESHEITSEVIKTDKVDSAALINGVYETTGTKLNGSSVETDSPVAETSNLISHDPSGLIDKPIAINEDNDMLPPPASPHPPADDSVEENGASNEEISESFPLPPSELCPSESESPEPIQEMTSSPVEKVEEISVPEINSDKLVADMKEQASAVLAAASADVATGAGDGAPSD